MYEVGKQIQMKKILLVDVDSKIPNLALMKLSTYYKQKGYEIVLERAGLSYYPSKKVYVINTTGYKIVFISIIFKTNKDKILYGGDCKHVVFGGVGISLKKKLLDNIEQLEPDYSIYPDNSTSYGFITRGCINNCYFCVVPEKEGNLHQVNTINNIIKHKKVKFIDNNILAFKDHLKIFEELVAKQIKCQFNQGLDIRLLNENNAKLLSEMNYIGEYSFAFDNLKDEQTITQKLKLFKKYVTKDWKARFFLYCHPQMNIKQNVIRRVEWCKKNKVLPYLMRDIACWNDKNKEFYIDLAAYCNQPNIFKKLSFEEFMNKRTKNKERILKSINIYNDTKYN